MSDGHSDIPDIRADGQSGGRKAIPTFLSQSVLLLLSTATDRPRGLSRTGRRGIECECRFHVSVPLQGAQKRLLVIK